MYLMVVVISHAAYLSTLPHCVLARGKEISLFLPVADDSMPLWIDKYFIGRNKPYSAGIPTRIFPNGRRGLHPLTSIDTPDGTTFSLPDELQNTKLYKYLITSQIFGRVKKHFKEKALI